MKLSTKCYNLDSKPFFICFVRGPPPPPSLKCGKNTSDTLACSSLVIFVTHHVLKFFAIHHLTSAMPEYKIESNLYLFICRLLLSPYHTYTTAISLDRWYCFRFTFSISTWIKVPTLTRLPETDNVIIT